MLVGEIEFPVHGEAQIPCVPFSLHESSRRVAVWEQQVTYLVSHRMRKHDHHVQVVCSGFMRPVQVRLRDVRDAVVKDVRHSTPVVAVSYTHLTLPTSD